MTWDYIAHGERVTIGDGRRVFACTCRGCRNDRRSLSGLLGDTLETFQAGHYFDRDTMRGFRSRVLWANQSLGTGDVFAGVSSARRYDGTGRVYDLVRLCPFGEMVRPLRTDDDAPNGRLRWMTPGPLQRLRGGGYWSVGWHDCDCHGCTLDREHPARLEAWRR